MVRLDLRTSSLAAIAVALGVIVVGWPFATGAMLNLDLIVFDDIPNRSTPVSDAADFPRRGAVYLLLDALTPTISGVVLVRVWMVAIIAVAFVGVVRWLRELTAPIALGAGVLYALSPFLLTRLGVGHIGLAASASLLPWSIETLLHPSDRPRRTFLWVAAHACFGYSAGALIMPLILTGLVADRGRRAAVTLFAVATAQAVWIVPAVLALPRTSGLPGSDSFTVPVASVGEGLRLALGYGFWLPSQEVGSRHAMVAVLGCALLALAYVGQTLRTCSTQLRLLAAGLAGLVLAVAPTVPVLDTALNWLTSFAAFGWLREPHRFLVLFVLWVVTSAAGGVDALAASARSVASAGRIRLFGGLGLAMVVILATGTALWGLDGRLTVRTVPDSWSFLENLDSDDGAVVALPWSQYYDAALADGRRSHNPLPYVGSGDIIFSHDLELGEGQPERRDTRELAVQQTVRPASSDVDRRYGEELSSLGVRWVVADVASIDDFEETYGHLLTDEEIDVTFDNGIVLLTVRQWQATAVGRSGEVLAVDAVTPWWSRVSGSEAFEWFRAPLGGWTRGTVNTNPEIASLTVSEGGRHLIYWPALLSMLAVAAWMAAVIFAGWRELSCSRRGIALDIPSEVEE